MSVKARGSARELKVKRLLERHLFIVYKAGGSLGHADLVALRADVIPMLIQVKATAAGPFAGFGPYDRGQLQRESERAGAVAMLAHWPPNGKLRWYVGPDWEETTEVPFDLG